MFEWLRYLTEHFGYLAVAVGAFLEGEVSLLLGALASREGILVFPGVVLAAFLGTLVADNTWFYLGRHLGQPFIARRRHWRERAAHVRDLLERYGAGFIVGLRFYYGLRTITPFVIGAARVSRVKFFLCDLLGTLLWTVVMGAAALLLGAAINRVVALLNTPGGVAALAITGVAVFTIAAALFGWRLRRVHRAERR